MNKIIKNIIVLCIKILEIKLLIKYYCGKMLTI